MQRYTMLGQIGDGAFGVVSKAQHQNTGEIVAVKRMKQRFQTWEECLQLREILSLRRLQHTNIIKLKEVVRENTELFLIFEFMEGSIYNIQKNRTEQVGQGGGGVFNEKEIRCIIAQVLLGLQSVHKGGFMHRDLKPENLLIKGDIVKLADFGLAKEIRSRPPFTEYVSTRWYRAPEIVLRSTHYNSPIDIWAAGVIFAELFLNRALLPGSSDSDQLFKICSVLGTPNVSDWDEGFQLARKLNVRFPSVCAPPLRQQIPNASNDALSLIEMMLRFNPSERPTASQCLQHPFFCQQLGSTEQISSHYQGVQSNMPHNPFTVGAGPQLPGSSASSAANQGSGIGGIGGNQGNNTPIGHTQGYLNNMNNNNTRSSSVQSSVGGMPPPPNVIGASAHRQSPLGNPIGAGSGGGYGQFGSGNINNNNQFNSIPGRATNSPIGSYHPSFGGHQRSNSINNSQQQQNQNQMMNNSGNNFGISGRSGSVGGQSQQQQQSQGNFGGYAPLGGNNNSNQQQQQQQNQGGGVIGAYGRRQSPMRQPPPLGNNSGFNTGLAPFNSNQGGNMGSSSNPSAGGGQRWGSSSGMGGGGNNFSNNNQGGGLSHPSFGGGGGNRGPASFGEDQY